MHPIFVHLSHVSLPTFGVLVTAGLFAALFLSLRTAVVCGLEPDRLWDAGLFAIVAAFVGSRLLLLLTNLRGFLEAPMLLLTVPSLTAGGLLLTVLATMIFLRMRRLPILRVLDAWAAPGLLLWGALALGHLAEGSDPGMPAARFGLKTSLAGYREQPVALYVAMVAFVLFGWAWARTRRAHRAGRVAAAALILAGVAQFLLSFLRLPFLYASRTPFAVLDPVQWAALLLLVVGLALLMMKGVPATGLAGPGQPEARGAGTIRDVAEES